jgi:hypothetical protein
MLSFTRHPEIDFTHFVSIGYTTIQDWLKTVIEYGKVGMTGRELYDLRQQTNLFSVEEVGMIFQRTLKDAHLRPPDGKTAVVVDEMAKVALIKVYESQARDHKGLSNLHVFYGLGEAVEWLGHDIAQFL